MELQSRERIFDNDAPESMYLSVDDSESEFVQDIAGDLQVFIQLSKVGHYERAMPFFDAYLEQHIVLFPVAAEYANALLEQGAFNQADEFLSSWSGMRDDSSESTTSSETERHILKLLKVIARMHTKLEYETAIALARDVISKLENGRTVRLNDQELQAMTLCLHIFDEALRVPHFEFIVSRRIPGSLLHCVSASNSSDEQFEDLIRQLGTSRHVWLMQKLLWVQFRDMKSETWLSWAKVLSLMSSMPGDCPPAVLAKLAIIGDYCQALLEDRQTYMSVGRSDLPDGLLECIDVVTQPTPLMTSFFSMIGTNMEDTRQYRNVWSILACFQAVPESATIDIDSSHRDYTMILLTQCNLARFQRIRAIDQGFIRWLEEVRNNGDRLGLSRLLELLDPFSQAARWISLNSRPSEDRDSHIGMDIRRIPRPNSQMPQDQSRTYPSGELQAETTGGTQGLPSIDNSHNASPRSRIRSMNQMLPRTTQTEYQDCLATYCRRISRSVPLSPNYQIISDRRAGRTAWSCTVTVGSQTVHARFWYDGQYVNNAREDAAERALHSFGQLPQQNSPQPAHSQYLLQEYFGSVNG